MRIDPEHCTDPVLLAAEVRRLRAVIASGDTIDAEREHTAAATLRGLLERCAEFAKRESDSPQPIATCNTTPNPHATPGECSVPTGCTETGG
jgi:hypothetical protein